MSEPTTAERPVSKTLEEIGKEALRIEEAALYSSKGHFKAAELWGWSHNVIGLATVILAGIAGAKAFSNLDADGTIAGILSIAVVVLSSVTTFLDPNKKASTHLGAGNKYEALVNKVRIFRTIECWGDSSEQALTSKLMGFSQEKAELNEASPQVSSIAYRLGKAGILRGEAEYSADRRERPAR